MKSLCAKALCAILACGSMAGCQTEYGAAAIKYDGDKCSALGYQRNTPDYTNCMGALYAGRQQQTARQNQLLAAAIVGAAVVGTVAVAANNGPYYRRPAYCTRYRCYYY